MRLHTQEKGEKINPRTAQTVEQQTNARGHQPICVQPQDFSHCSTHWGVRQLTELLQRRGGGAHGDTQKTTTTAQAPERTIQNLRTPLTASRCCNVSACMEMSAAKRKTGDTAMRAVRCRSAARIIA